MSQTLLTIQLRFPAEEELGERLAALLAEAVKTGALSTSISLQGYEEESE